jgi:NADH-quinone oxidoreductase subunit N
VGTIDSLRLFCPEATLTVTILAVLMVDLLMRRRPAVQVTLVAVALLGLAGAAAACFHLAGTEARAIFSGMVALDSLAVFFKIFSLIVGALGIIFAAVSDEIERERFGEYLALLLSLTLGMMLLASANNLLMIYLSLEFVSITSYVLSGWRRHHRPASEAALKYVIYGGVASGIMLYGLSLMYGLAGTLDLTALQSELAKVADQGLATRAALTVAGIFTLAGFAYKVAAVPFHMWCPDVYEGAPTPFTAFLSVGPKAAGFAVLLRFFHVVMGDSANAIGDVFPSILIIGVVSVATMTMGNLVALTQTNVKRLLAWSSVAHAGYLLLGLVAANTAGIRAVLIYLCVYLLMNLGAFLAVIAVRDRTGSEEISAYKGLATRAPVVAILLAIFLFSLVGLPPFAGFVGKFYIFAALVEGFDPFKVTLAIIGVLNSAVSLYYYAKIIRAMFFDAPETDAPPLRPRLAHVAILACLAIPTLVLGVYWSPLAETLRHAVVILGA